MATSEKVIKNKLGLLELSQQLGNVSGACKYEPYLAARTSTIPRSKPRALRQTASVNASTGLSRTNPTPSLSERRYTPRQNNCRQTLTLG